MAGITISQKVRRKCRARLLAIIIAPTSAGATMLPQRHLLLRLEPDLASGSQRGRIDFLEISLQVRSRPFDQRERPYRRPTLSCDFHQAVQVVAEFPCRLDEIAHSICPRSRDSISK